MNSPGTRGLGGRPGKRRQDPEPPIAPLDVGEAHPRSVISPPAGRSLFPHL